MRLSRSKVLNTLALAAVLCATPPAAPRRFEFRQIHMGVRTRLVLYAAGEADAARAAAAAFARIAELDSLLSDYRSDSELTALSRRAGGPPVRVSEELFLVLASAQRLARLSDGAFDVTAGPLVELWRRARRTGEPPSPEALRDAAARVGWRKLRLDSTARTVRLLAPGMRLDLGGIAKGYAGDEALAALRRHGIRRALVEMGGDIVAAGPPPGRRGWIVRIADAAPGRDTILLAHAAVSTSGDAAQFLEVDGERYSHVIDTRTGMGMRDGVAATIVARDGITADALSTLARVLGPERGAAFLAAHYPDAIAYIRRVDRDERVR
ncbi:MAG TPA: FAD:protein FMN transferase [Longimicrobiales bacterium]